MFFTSYNVGWFYDVNFDVCCKLRSIKIKDWIAYAGVVAIVAQFIVAFAFEISIDIFTSVPHASSFKCCMQTPIIDFFCAEPIWF